jgi:hypothetical protein
LPHLPHPRAQRKQTPASPLPQPHAQPQQSPAAVPPTTVPEGVGTWVGGDPVLHPLSCSALQQPGEHHHSCSPKPFTFVEKLRSLLCMGPGSGRRESSDNNGKQSYSRRNQVAPVL